MFLLRGCIYHYNAVPIACVGGHQGIRLRSIEVDQYLQHIHTNSHVLSTQLGTMV